LLISFFWVEAGHRVGWADAIFALVAAFLCVWAISILARSSEKTKKIVRSTWQAKLLLVLGTVFLIFGFLYADVYFIHHQEITASRLRHDVVMVIALAIAVFLSFRSGIAAGRSHLH
jgi:uncharacterized membrane protein